MVAMINVELTLVVQLAKSLGVHVSTVYRWGSPCGVRGHRLRLTRIGGRTYVYRCDWDAFCRALNGEAVEKPQAEHAVQPAGNDLIDAKLDAAGF